jgi:small subunit ribosomal protein S24e
MVHQSSVNNKARENLQAESAVIVGENHILAFVEKVTQGGKFDPNAPLQLRTTTRLDPMTYMLFGAYHLRVTGNGLLCDDWLPINGDLDALDDLQRLKTLLDQCMLRVFEGVGKSQAPVTARQKVKPKSRIDDSDEEGKEGESQDEEDETPKNRALTSTEIVELDNLASDVVGEQSLPFSLFLALTLNSEVGC